MSTIRPILPIAGAGALAALLALALAPSARATAEPGRDLGAVVHDALHADGPLVLPEERRLIAEKCGYAEEDARSRSINSRDGILICGNGRTVDDPETRAMTARIGARAGARVEAVMASPAVKAAMDGTIEAEVERAMRRLETVDMPRIRAALADARVDAEAIRRDVRRALARDGMIRAED